MFPPRLSGHKSSVRPTASTARATASRAGGVSRGQGRSSATVASLRREGLDVSSLIDAAISHAERASAPLCHDPRVEVLQPTSWCEALEARAAHPEALAVQGGTDVLVALNFDRARPPALLDLSAVAELREWSVADGVVRLGAGVTYTRITDELVDALP